jgi:nucleotide-binding universal stress UspA family protein
VAVLPTDWLNQRSPAEGPVVVGLSSTTAGRTALQAAFAAAALRGRPVHVVRSWYRPDPEGFADPVVYQAGERFLARQRELAEAKLTDLRAAYPQVPVTITLSPETVHTALLEAAAKAELLVIGCRFADGHRYSRLGPTTAHLLHHAPCPVEVVGRSRDSAAFRDPSGSAVLIG